MRLTSPNKCSHSLPSSAQSELVVLTYSLASRLLGVRRRMFVPEAFKKTFERLVGLMTLQREVTRGVRRSEPIHLHTCNVDSEATGYFRSQV